MSFYLGVIWPLEGPPPSYEKSHEVFDKVDSNLMETKSMARWFSECLTGEHMDVVARMGLRPYSLAHMYELIEEDEEFPDGRDAWVSPDEMIEATRKFLSLIGNDDPDALVLVECFVTETRTRRAGSERVGPRPRFAEGEDSFEVGLWRAQALRELLNNLEGVIATARACKKAGIDRIAFCYF